MPQKDEKGNWILPTGETVPPKFVKTLDKRRDRMVEQIVRESRKVNGALTRLRRYMESQIGDYLAWLEKEENVSLNKGGNYLFTSFSGDLQVEVKVAQFLDFDERLQVAKTLVDQCIDEWSEGANDKIKVIVQEAFSTNKGRLDTKRVLGLRRYQIKDARWQHAMTLIGESVVVSRSKSYIRVRERVGADEAWQAIALDLAQIPASDEG